MHDLTVEHHRQNPHSNIDKNVENPSVRMRLLLQKTLCGNTKRKVFFLEKKCDNMTRKVINEPNAVASPAP